MIQNSNKYKYWVFFALAIGLFASVMDHGSVIVALPSTASDLKIDLPSVQWVVIGFSLTISALLLPMGRLSDIIGRKRVYVLGSLIMVMGAAGAGFAPNLWVLIVARVVQGCGAAMTQGTGMAIMTQVFPARERGQAIGLIMTTVGVGAVAGPAIGGLVVDLLSWRAVFLLNIPLGLAGVLATLAVLRSWESERAPGKTNFDWTGAVLSTGMMVSLLLGLTLAHKTGWTSAPILTALVLSGALFVVFIWWELRCRTPMLDLSFFRFRIFSFGVSAAFLTFLGSSSVLFLMPFYLQNVLGYSPKVAGLAIVPGALCMAVMGSVSGVLSDRFGWRWFTVGGMMCDDRRAAGPDPIDRNIVPVDGDAGPDVDEHRHGDVLFPQRQLGVEFRGAGELRSGLRIPEPGAELGQCDQLGHRHHYSYCHHGVHGLRAKPWRRCGRDCGGSKGRLHPRNALRLLRPGSAGNRRDDLFPSSKGAGQPQRRSGQAPPHPWNRRKRPPRGTEICSGHSLVCSE